MPCTATLELELPPRDVGFSIGAMQASIEAECHVCLNGCCVR